MLACCSMASLPGLALARGAGAEAMDVAADALLPPPTPLTASQALYLDTTLNQAPRGLLRFDELGGRLQAPAATLRQNVTSPNGTTAAALAVLMANDGLQPLLTKAVQAAEKRSRELSA